MLARRAAAVCAALFPAWVLAAGAARTAPASAAPASCTGEYADMVSAMSRATRAFEASPDAGYTYCIRTVATYERVYYGKGGKLRRQYVRHVRHGTGFAYRAKDGEWFLATNEHVVEHPDVTDQERELDGVPAGSRKVRETIRIVSNESDDDDRSHIALTKVASDEALDVAVLKTRHPLAVMPYRIGHSSALRLGNMVQVRGYPLGAFAAANAGRVISTGQLDRERAWNHEDFAVDALLNAGNSGSPVLAVSCRTGELELVGIYHAGYKDAQGLNVVVAVDQLRELLETGRAARRDASRTESLDRGSLVARLRRAPTPFFMPFGDRTVRVGLDGQVVRFDVLDAEFPLSAAVEVALVDRDGDLTEPSGLVVPRRSAERELAWASLDGGLREPAQRLYDALWRQLSQVLSFRDAEARGRASSESRAALAASASHLRGRRADQRELLQAVSFEAEDLAWTTTAGVEPPPGKPADPAAEGR